MATNEVYMAAEDSLATKHQPKRLRLYGEEDVLLNDEEYEEAVEVLQDKYNNRTKRKEAITKL